MTLFVLLNIGHDISNFCAQLDRDIESARTSSALLKIILWPVHYFLVFVKILSKYVGQGTMQAYNYGIPETIADMRAHILAATPSSITCFNKTKFLLFVVDAYFIFFYFDKISIRPEFGYIYLVCKLAMVALPFLSLSPTDRLPFWVLGFGLTILEICVGLWLMTSWGYGINWENDHFYNHWKKHYRYRYASGNRQFTVELCQWTYPILKFLVFVDFVCWHKAQQAIRAVKKQKAAVLEKAKKQQEKTRGALDFGLSDSVLAAEHLEATTTISSLLLGIVFTLFISYLFLSTFAAEEHTQSTSLFNCSGASECSIGQSWCVAGAVAFTGLFIAPVLGLASIKAHALFWSFYATYKTTRFIDNHVQTLPEEKHPKSSSTKGALDLDLNYLSSLLEQDSVANLRYGILFLLALSSLGVYSIILTGWSSNSKYAFIGALRSAAQMISYGAAISLVILPIVLFAGPLNLTMITCVCGAAVWCIFYFFLLITTKQTNKQYTTIFTCKSTSECALGATGCAIVAAAIVSVVIAPHFFACSVTQATLFFLGFGASYEVIKCVDEHLLTLPEEKRAKSSSTKGALDLDLNYLSSLLEQDSVANLRYGILFLLALSSLGVYSIILAGWSSNSKYAFIGALRSAAQMISYEVAISLIILPIVLFAGSLNLTMITYMQSITVWFIWPLLPISVLFLIAMLAETNRTPFDLPEAEAELVAGYNVDYSSLPFAMFFLGEYCNMILISTLYCILFLGGGLNDLGLSPALLLSLKASLTWIYFVLVRATLPRYRYDQLMDIGWKYFLPSSGGFLIFVFGLLVYFKALPVANELPLTSTCAVAALVCSTRREVAAVSGTSSIPAVSRAVLWDRQSTCCCCIDLATALLGLAIGLWLYGRANPQPRDPDLVDLRDRKETPFERSAYEARLHEEDEDWRREVAREREPTEQEAAHMRSVAISRELKAELLAKAQRKLGKPIEYGDLLKKLDRKRVRRAARELKEYNDLHAKSKAEVEQEWQSSVSRASSASGGFTNKYDADFSYGGYSAAFFDLIKHFHFLASLLPPTLHGAAYFLPTLFGVLRVYYHMGYFGVWYMSIWCWVWRPVFAFRNWQMRLFSFYTWF